MEEEINNNLFERHGHYIPHVKEDLFCPNEIKHVSAMDRSINYLLDAVYAKNISRKKDCFILLEQDKGSGKSTLAIQIAKKWVKKVKEKLPEFEGEWDLDKYIIYDDNLADIIQRIKTLPLYSPLIFDEGGRIALGEDWNRKSNKEIKKLMAEIRTKHFLVIINSPFSIKNIDSKYLQNFFHFWIHLWGFGFATIFDKTLNPLHKGFYLDKLDEILPAYMDEICDWDEFVNLVKRLKQHECYFGELFWQPLSPQEYAKYQRLRDKAVYDDEKNEGEEMFQSASRKHRRRLYVSIKLLREAGLSDDDIAKAWGIKKGTLQTFYSTCKYAYEPSEQLNKGFN